jgi:hypothetical protein
MPWDLMKLLLSVRGPSTFQTHIVIGDKPVYLDLFLLLCCLYSRSLFIGIMSSSLDGGEGRVSVEELWLVHRRNGGALKKRRGGIFLIGFGVARRRCLGIRALGFDFSLFWSCSTHD